MNKIIVSKRFVNDKNKSKFDISVDQLSGIMTVTTKSGKTYKISGYEDGVGKTFKLNGKEFDDVNDALSTLNEEAKDFNEWLFNNTKIKNLIRANFIDDVWITDINGEDYICASPKPSNPNTVISAAVIGVGTKSHNVITDKMRTTMKNKFIPILNRIWNEFCSINEEVLDEENTNHDKFLYQWKRAPENQKYLRKFTEKEINDTWSMLKRHMNSAMDWACGDNAAKVYLKNHLVSTKKVGGRNNQWSEDKPKLNYTFDYEVCSRRLRRELDKK